MFSFTSLLHNVHPKIDQSRSVNLFEDRYVVVYLGLLSLCDTFCDPDNVTTLLLLQFDVGVKYSKVELLQESKCVQLHLGKDR